jgi:hypothetical protein
MLTDKVDLETQDGGVDTDARTETSKSIGRGMMQDSLLDSTCGSTMHSTPTLQGNTGDAEEEDLSARTGPEVTGKDGDGFEEDDEEE